jgi:hypothetical protein
MECLISIIRLICALCNSPYSDLTVWRWRSMTATCQGLFFLVNIKCLMKRASVYDSQRNSANRYSWWITSPGHVDRKSQGYQVPFAKLEVIKLQLKLDNWGKVKGSKGLVNLIYTNYPSADEIVHKLHWLSYKKAIIDQDCLSHMST